MMINQKLKAKNIKKGKRKILNNQNKKNPTINQKKKIKRKKIKKILQYQKIKVMRIVTATHQKRVSQKVKILMKAKMKK